MSVTIKWRPVTDSGKCFPDKGTSGALAKLEEVFGDKIGPKDVPTLRAMKVASGDPFFDHVADTVEAVGAIYVWGEW